MNTIRYLYNKKVHSKEIGTGIITAFILYAVKVKRPKSFSNKRLMTESFSKYKKRLKDVKIYVKAMANGINKIEPRIYNV